MTFKTWWVRHPWLLSNQSHTIFQPPNNRDYPTQMHSNPLAFHFQKHSRWGHGLRWQFFRSFTLKLRFFSAENGLAKKNFLGEFSFCNAKTRWVELMMQKFKKRSCKLIFHESNSININRLSSLILFFNYIGVANAKTRAFKQKFIEITLCALRRKKLSLIRPDWQADKTLQPYL